MARKSKTTWTYRWVAPDVYEVRSDPTSPLPDHRFTTLGEICHFQETGHPQAKGCCSLVDANGRHLLPRFRQPKTDT